MYLDQKRTRRHKRRDFMAKYREQKLDSMTPEERTSTLERIREFKHNQHFHERGMFIEQIKKMDGNSLSMTKVDRLKKMIRADYQKYRDLNDDGYDSFEGRWVKGPSTKDEKIYYGSDSNSDVDSFGEVDNERVEEILKRNDNQDEPQQKLMYQQFLFDDWKRKNQKGGILKAQNLGSSDEDEEESSIYEDEGNFGEELYEYDDEELQSD